MSSEQNERPSAPPLCANNCGFYGNPANRNLCSKCYREFLKAEDAQQPAQAAGACRRPSQQQACGFVPSAVAPPAAGAAMPQHTRAAADLERGAVTAAAEQPTAAPVASDAAPLPTTASESARCSDSSGYAPSEPAAASPPQSAPQAATGVVAVTSAEASLVAAAAESQPPSSASAPAAPAPEIGEPSKGRSSRCRQCNRKVGLLGFQCRCGHSFCGEHRYADAHGCAFDYKTFEREQLKKQNNRVVADKLQKL